MKKRFLAFILISHVMAMGLARAEVVMESPKALENTAAIAEDSAPVPAAAASVRASVGSEECEKMLAQAESDYNQVHAKFTEINQKFQKNHGLYLTSFNEMTEVLFEMTNKKEAETRAIVDDKKQLEDSLAQYNQARTPETSKDLQDKYFNLTVRIYSAAMDSQKTIETLKERLTSVEASRNQYESQKKEFENLDSEKLTAEGKLLSAKLRCQQPSSF